MDDDVDALAREVGRRLADRSSTIAVAESLTGGILVQALARVEGSGEWLLGGLVAYARQVKHEVLGVTAAKVVSETAAREMASGVRRLLGADVAVAVTGVGGPDPQDGEPPGTVWIGIDDGTPAAALLTTDGSPGEICEAAVATSLRRVLDALDGD